ncbi:MAG: SDR family oxidoreductase [Alphaproteobacteria bacterium]|nr:SDR family oxidoreductase [Alphaproteobacteria bacterium]
MSNSLNGKVAVITGASSGIGRSVADKFLAEGAKIAVFARNESALAEIAKGNEDRVLVVVGDVTNAADLDRLVASTVAKFGGVDIVVPNAGIAKVVGFEQSDAAAIDHQFSVNFTGAVQTVRGFLPHIRKGGSVLFVTTFLTQVGFPGLGIYSASKAALKSFSQTLAAELAPKGIRVNSVAPGPIATPIWGTIGLPADVLQAVATQVTARLMPGNFGEPGDIAATALFLCSDAAKNIWGQEIVVDGGYTIG